MKVVRLLTAGSDHKNIVQLPIPGLPKARNSTEVTGNPGMGSSLDVGSIIKPDAPLGLHPDVLSLLVTGIAVNSNANLRLDSSPSGGHLNLHSAGHANALSWGEPCCFKLQKSQLDRQISFGCAWQVPSLSTVGYIHFHNHPLNSSFVSAAVSTD